MKHALIVWEPEGATPQGLRKALQLAANVATVTIAQPAVIADTSRADYLLSTGEAPATGTRIDIQTIDDDDVADWVLKTVERAGIDLVITTARRDKSLFYTPADWKLIRGLPCPLLICGHQSWKQRPLVLATVDVHGNDAKQTAINGRVLHAASEWTQQFDGKLHVAYVIPIARPLNELDIVEPSEVVTKHGAEAQNQVQRELDAHGVSADAIHVKAGSPHLELAGLARARKADLVVLGSIGRKGLPGLLLGNTAEKIIGNLRADLLIIKP